MSDAIRTLVYTGEFAPRMAAWRRGRTPISSTSTIASTAEDGMSENVLVIGKKS